MTLKGSRVTAKKSREARQFNRENHTHFKQFNKREATSTKHTNVINDMRSGTDPREYEVFHRQKKDLLVGMINTSATVTDLPPISFVSSTS